MNTSNLPNFVVAPLARPDTIIEPAYDSEVFIQIKKVFVGGVNPEWTKQDLKNHFSQFGAIQTVIRTRNDDKSYKTFAFVIFVTEEGTANALKQRKQTILNKVVDVGRAYPHDKHDIRQPSTDTPTGYEKDVKVVITSIKDINGQETKWSFHVIQAVHTYFSSFGVVNQIEEDRKTEAHYIVFDKEEIAEAVLIHNNGLHIFNLMTIELKKNEDSSSN